MRRFWKKSIFWGILVLVLATILIPLSFYLFKPQILSTFSYLFDKRSSQKTAKPGRCLILEEKFCSQGKLVERQTALGVKSKFIGFRLSAGVTIFSPLDGQIHKVRLNEKVIFYKGTRATVFNIDIPKRRYILTGDLQFNDMLSQNMKEGEVFGYTQDTDIDMLGFNFVFYVADIGPDNREIINEEEISKLFPSIKL